MSILAKRSRSQSTESAGARQHSRSPMPRTSTTATDHSASASAALTPLTPMETSELGHGDPKSPVESVEEQRLKSTQDSSWQGWAELENDPAIFSVMLREWGVEGVQVREVIPLDAILDSSPDSTYGLILLARYAPPEPDASFQAAPRELWFANQTSTYSCASVALMNIINNRQDVRLGEKLDRFRSSTAALSSKNRGLALDSFGHVRNVHNSFAAEIDIMTVDLKLKMDAKDAAKKKKAQSQPSRKGKKRKKRKNKTAAVEEDEESGFHFVAYVPAYGQIWKLDGLERRPQTLGDLDKDSNWLVTVVPDLQMQMDGAPQDELGFSLLSLGSSEGPGGASEEAEDLEKATRLREDWGPLLAGLVKMHAEKGTLEEILWD